MREKLTMLSGALLASVMVMGVNAEDVTGAVGVDINSAYIFRGGTVNDEVNVTPFIEATAYGVTFGTWGNLNTDTEQFDEIDYYVSYEIPLAEDSPVSLGLGYTEYTFPTAVTAVPDTRAGAAEGATVNVGTEADREIGLTLGVDTLFSPSLFVGFGLEGPFLDEGIYLELSGGYDYELEDAGVTLNAGAALGYEAGDNFVENGFSHLTLSVGAAYDIGTLTLNYVVETDDDVLVVDEDFYISFGVAI